MHRLAAVEQPTARVEALLSRVDDPLIRAWTARLVAETVGQAFLDWLDVGAPARDGEMVERLAYLLAGMVASLWARPAGMTRRRNERGGRDFT